MEDRTKIVINGKEYGGIDDVPEQLRPLIEKQIEAARQNPGKTAFHEETFDTPLENIPPEILEKLGKLPPFLRDKVLQAMAEKQRGVNADISFDFNAKRGSEPSLNASLFNVKKGNGIEPSSGAGWVIIAIAAGAAAYYFMNY